MASRFEHRGEPVEEMLEHRAGTIFVEIEEESRKGAADGEDCALLRDLVCGHVVEKRRGAYESPRECDQEEEGEDLLSHSVGSLRVKLVVAEVFVLLETKEGLDLPPTAVEGEDLSAAELAAAQRRKEDLRPPVRTVSTHGSKLDRRAELDRSVAPGDEEDPVVHAARLKKVLDRGESVVGRHAHDEVDSPLEERSHDLVRRESAVEKEDVAVSKPLEEREEMLPLVGVRGLDSRVQGDLRDDVDECRDHGLGREAALGSSERFEEGRGSLEGDLGGVDGEDAPSADSVGEALVAVERIDDVMEKRPEGLGSELPSRLAKACRGHRLLGREIEPLVPGVLPERFEQVPVPASCAVGDKVEEQCDKQLGPKGTAACEVAGPILQDRIETLLSKVRDAPKCASGGKNIGMQFSAQPPCHAWTPPVALKDTVEHDPDDRDRSMLVSGVDADCQS